MKNEVFCVMAALFLGLSFASAKAHAQPGVGFGAGFPGGGFGGAAWRTGGGIAGGGWGVGNVPGFGFGGASRFMAGNPAWQGGTAGAGAGWTGWNSGVPGTMGSWSVSHPYSWYSGNWNNHRYGNGFGGYGSGNYPLGWGRGGYGLGNQWYNSGYVPYYNPYYVPAVTGPYSYGKPIPVPVGAKLSDSGNPDVALAIDKFRMEDYAGALALVDGVIRLQPYDAAAHELRSLTLFALKEYTQSAATIHSVLAIGPGWNWTTLSSVYTDMQTYQSQLAALEKYVSLHPKQADARFLLAYHYTTAGHTDEAKQQLEQVVALVPSDKLAAHLLHMVGHGNTAVQPTVQPPPAPAPVVTPVDPQAIVGDWNAKRDDGSAFELELKPDKTFTWKMVKKDQSRTLTGQYALNNATLTLNGANQGSMVAQVSVDGPNRFTFTPVGGPPGDPGLTFTK